MATIAQYITAQKEFNTRLGVAIDGLTEDINTLDAKISELQNSPGTVTPADQALLDEVQAQIKALADKAEALDSLHSTAPVNPTTPPTP